MSLAATWPGLDGVLYGFTGRLGGVSRSPYDEFNLSFAVGDDPEHVQRNREILAATLPRGSRFARLIQVHGAKVVRVDSQHLDEVEADAVVTAESGVVCSVMTADCVPILLVAEDGEVVAAVHAGWRGTAANIAGAALEEMRNAFGVDVRAVQALLGPAIGACCYDVGDVVVEALRATLGSGVAECVAGGSLDGSPDGSVRVDLRAANTRLLRDAGVAASAIRAVGPCTRCHAGEYFSHRAAAGAPTGRQVSFIVRR